MTEGSGSAENIGQVYSLSFSVPVQDVAGLRDAIFDVARKAIYLTAHNGPDDLCGIIADGAIAALQLVPPSQGDGVICPGDQCPVAMAYDKENDRIIAECVALEAKLAVAQPHPDVSVLVEALKHIAALEPVTDETTGRTDEAAQMTASQALTAFQSYQEER